MTLALFNDRCYGAKGTCPGACTVTPMTIPMTIEMLHTNIEDRSWVKGKTAPQNADRDCKLDTLFHENHKIDTLIVSCAGRA